VIQPAVDDREPCLVVVQVGAVARVTRHDETVGLPQDRTVAPRSDQIFQGPSSASWCSAWGGGGSGDGAAMPPM
jgi:hypothetical protein